MLVSLDRRNLECWNVGKRISGIFLVVFLFYFLIDVKVVIVEKWLMNLLGVFCFGWKSVMGIGVI